MLFRSAILLGGLILNAIFGLWWADPVAAMVMVPIITKEGIDAPEGQTVRRLPLIAFAPLLAYAPEDHIDTGIRVRNGDPHHRESKGSIDVI